MRVAGEGVRKEAASLRRRAGKNKLLLLVVGGEDHENTRRPCDVGNTTVDAALQVADRQGHR